MSILYKSSFVLASHPSDFNSALSGSPMAASTIAFVASSMVAKGPPLKDNEKDLDPIQEQDALEHLNFLKEAIDATLNGDQLVTLSDLSDSELDEVLASF